jgi:WD40 repeat protein
MAFNPTNPDELAVGTADGAVTIWRLQEGKPMLSVQVGESAITALAFNPDGELLAVASKVGAYRVFLYNTHTGQLFGQSFRAHDEGPTVAMQFSPDGLTLLTASTDSTIVFHDMNPEAWQERACRLANRNLTRDEWKLYIGDTAPYEAICPQFPTESEARTTP